MNNPSTEKNIKSYPCMFPLPQPDYPKSILIRITDIMKSYMKIGDGYGCLCFKKREK
jgi:hypothetical protein